MLKNLNELAQELQRKYNEEFDSREVVLSEEFMDAYGRYLRGKSQNIDYTQHTAVVTTSSSLKMYIPNQWFRAAAFMVPYTIELKKYKELAESIIHVHYVTKKLATDYFVRMKNTSDIEAIQELEEWVKDYCGENGIDNEGDILEEQITKFISDYSWWSGSKTIDRGDFYVSPVLSLLGVVNSSQSYIADISYDLATNEELILISEKMINTETETDISSDLIDTLEVEAERKTGGVNEIVYGAPGTGKSRYLEDKYKSAPLTRRVVFHSEYSYYDFVGVYKPMPVYKESAEIFKTVDEQNFNKGEPYIDYRFVAGPFIQVLIEAWLDPARMHTLLIEEINRADAAGVFGEVFQLLDRDVDGKSEYSYEPSKDLKEYLLSVNGMEQYVKNGIYIPSNMNIVATMNSADQCVKPMDSAFKRRWNFHYMRINIQGAVHEKGKIKYAGRECYWGTLVTIINQKLVNGTLQVEEDKLIGPYFIKPDEIGKKRALDKLLLYLWDDVLRHDRDSFFNNEIRIFADLLEKFEEEDVLDIVNSTYEEGLFILDEENQDDELLSEEDAESIDV